MRFMPSSTIVARGCRRSRRRGGPRHQLLLDQLVGELFAGEAVVGQPRRRQLVVSRRTRCSPLDARLAAPGWPGASAGGRPGACRRGSSRAWFVGDVLPREQVDVLGDHADEIGERLHLADAGVDDGVERAVYEPRRRSLRSRSRRSERLPGPRVSRGSRAPASPSTSDQALGWAGRAGAGWPLRLVHGRTGVLERPRVPVVAFGQSLLDRLEVVEQAPPRRRIEVADRGAGADLTGELRRGGGRSPALKLPRGRVVLAVSGAERWTRAVAGATSTGGVMPASSRFQAVAAVAEDVQLDDRQGRRLGGPREAVGE